MQNTNTGSSKRHNSVYEIFEHCMKFTRIHFSRIGNHRKQRGKWMHAEKNLIYGICKFSLLYIIYSAYVIHFSFFFIHKYSFMAWWWNDMKTNSHISRAKFKGNVNSKRRYMLIPLNGYDYLNFNSTSVNLFYFCVFSIFNV